MHDRIDTLETKAEPVVRISVPTKSGVIVRVYISENNFLSFDFDSDMKLTYVFQSKGNRNLHNNEIPKEDRDKYETFVRKAMVKTVKDIHDSMSF